MIKTKSVTRSAERGIALFFSLFALLLLTAIAGTLAFMASIETSVNSNYRQEQIAYFSAKAGLEEARARMMQFDPHPINGSLPTTAPTTGNNSVIYITNPAGSADVVQPWTSSNKYADDELCHDGYVAASGTLFTTSQFSSGVPSPGVRCTSDGTASGTVVLPTGTTWYTSSTSQLPNNGTTFALAYKWVRISPKLNSSASYLTISGSTVTTNNYSVNSTKTAATLICWDGAKEVPLNSADTQCSQMLNSQNSPMTMVYLVASLGVSPMGARKMVQAEVALEPTPPFIYGIYSTSTTCPAITFSGNNPSTNSYTTAGGQTYAQTQTNTGGDVGAAGGISVGNGNIGGIVGVVSTANGGCATPVSINSQGTMGGTVVCPSGNSASCYLPVPYTFSVPVIPSSPPNTTTNPSTCGSGHSSYDCLAPGTYGNISITHPLTLAPGVYNINSLSMT